MLERAEIAIGEKIMRPAAGTVRRGRGRPKVERPKMQISIRLDRDVLDRLRGTGPGWQVRMNDVLREWLDSWKRA